MRSVLLGVVLAGVLAGCSLRGGGGAATSTGGHLVSSSPLPSLQKVTRALRKAGFHLRVEQFGPLLVRVSDSGTEAKYGLLLVQLPTGDATGVPLPGNQDVQFCDRPQLSVEVYFSNKAAVLYSPRYGKVTVDGGFRISCQRGATDKTPAVLRALYSLVPAGSLRQLPPARTVTIDSGGTWTSSGQ
jgi:hypothetical protein